MCWGYWDSVKYLQCTHEALNLHPDNNVTSQHQPPAAVIPMLWSSREVDSLGKGDQAVQ